LGEHCVNPVKVDSEGSGNEKAGGHLKIKTSTRGEKDECILTDAMVFEKVGKTVTPIASELKKGSGFLLSVGGGQWISKRNL